MGNESDSFDALLTDALQQYSAEPRAGLERRVLCRMRANHRRRLFRIGAFLLPIPAMALALFFLMRPTKVIEPPLKRAPVLAAAAKTVRPVPPMQRIHRRIVKVRPFPTPAPLTDEEKALLTFVASGGTLAHNDGPIEIKELQIPPLQSDGGQ